MMRLVLALLLLAPQSPVGAMTGRWRLESYTRERANGARDGRPVVETEDVSAATGTTLTVAASGNILTFTYTYPHIPSTSVERYEVDGQPHRYTWGDLLPGEPAMRTANWRDDGFVVSDEKRVSSPAQEYRFTISPDGQRLVIDIRYPSQAAPLAAHAVLHDVQVFTRF
jgi:hypothetical protein